MTKSRAGCFTFERTGQCSRGENCRYAHDTAHAANSAIADPAKNKDKPAGKDTVKATKAKPPKPAAYLTVDDLSASDSDSEASHLPFVQDHEAHHSIADDNAVLYGDNAASTNILVDPVHITGARDKASSLGTTNDASALTIEGVFGALGRAASGTNLRANLVSFPQLEAMRDAHGQYQYSVEKHVDYTNHKKNYYYVTHRATGLVLRFLPTEHHGFYGTTFKEARDFAAAIETSAASPLGISHRAHLATAVTPFTAREIARASDAWQTLHIGLGHPPTPLITQALDAGAYGPIAHTAQDIVNYERMTGTPCAVCSASHVRFITRSASATVSPSTIGQRTHSDCVDTNKQVFTDHKSGYMMLYWHKGLTASDFLASARAYGNLLSGHRHQLTERRELRTDNQTGMVASDCNIGQIGFHAGKSYVEGHENISESSNHILRGLINTFLQELYGRGLRVPKALIKRELWDAAVAFHNRRTNSKNATMTPYAMMHGVKPWLGKYGLGDLVM